MNTPSENNTNLVLGVVVALAVVLVFTPALWQRVTASPIVSGAPGAANGSLRVCPNQFTGEYFVLNGELRNLDEFDLEWVSRNCQL